MLKMVSASMLHSIWAALIQPTRRFCVSLSAF